MVSITTPFEAAFVGRALIAAELLEYSQIGLRFSGASIAVYNPITLQRGYQRIRSTESDFVSELSTWIGLTLQAIEEQPNEHVTLVFDSGDRLEISTKPDDYSGPEAFAAWGPNGEIFVEQ
jgi:hypothetical protein